MASSFTKMANINQPNAAAANPFTRMEQPINKQINNIIPNQISTSTSPLTAMTNAANTMTMKPAGTIVTPGAQSAVNPVTGGLGTPAVAPKTPDPAAGAKGAVIAQNQGMAPTPAPTPTLLSSNQIAPAQPNTAVSDFAQTVGGQYANTPWSQALQSSLNQYNDVWQQTKQQLNQQFASTNRGAAASAASSGFAPMGAASADLSRQASNTNANALINANNTFGSNMSNMMGQYGNSLLGASQSDTAALNNMALAQYGTQSAMDLSAQQHTYDTDLFNAQQAALPKAPGDLGNNSDAYYAAYNAATNPNPYSDVNHSATNTYTYATPSGGMGYNGAYLDINGQQVVMPSAIYQQLYNTYQGQQRVDAIKAWAAYSQTMGHAPTAADLQQLLQSKRLG